MTCFWLAELAFSLLMYVVLDGFDLGVGVLSGFAGDTQRRDVMVASISPVWDGNGTWLVIAGATLFGAFPDVYALLLPAFYLPLAGMLIGLIARGVAIEFRHKTVRGRWIWNVCFFAGSLLAAFMQGAAVGAYAQGLPVQNMEFVGTGLEWATPFSLWCGLSLVLGYGLLGAGWLALKTEGDVQAFGYVAIGRLLWMTLLAEAVVFATTIVSHPQVAARWHEHRALYVLPVAGLLASLGIAYGHRNHALRLSFCMTVLLFAVSFLALAASFLPYIVPFSVTLREAAAPASSQTFMFWGAGLFVMPMVVGYTWVAYRVFRGKVDAAHTYH
ncbi:cytochrome d ubiquinol oxidase subunit II [Paraburkholderia sp. CI2]|uniref:cytochrome d ubiquinol oxidase subunit II n=1 Tax=Paraburkholderia sp. CI2 TaxID=2723093 RepID=UPI00160884C8|nr:cytochrome d ubiquinol oxidase subunit II [Paraburkholderia sp. CI2]MBB5464978.1 cytochrome d ubiquinol oxidase subunit II [Paraburkholderia sp. CI2]